MILFLGYDKAIDGYTAKAEINGRVLCHLSNLRTERQGIDEVLEFLKTRKIPFEEDKVKKIYSENFPR